VTRPVLGGLVLGVVLAAVPSAPGQTAPASQAPVFRSEVEAVYVDTLVTRSGRFVPGLEAANFELKDNGVRQELELVAAESRPLLAVLVFDTSSSMAGHKLVALQEAGKAFLDGLRPADQAALMAFSEEISWIAGPTEDKAEVRRSLERLTAEGATAVVDALYAGITLSESGRRPLVVLFSDGWDNMSILGERDLRLAAERSNALIHVVAWQPPVKVPVGASSPLPVEPERERSLRQVAEVTGGRLWGADSPARLREAFAAIADAMGHRYVLRYEPEGVKREGWHRIELRLRGEKGDVQSRRGYWVPPPH
jgi:VWFA-related protein